MRLTAPPLRGLLYDGLLTKSCFAYNPCSVCRLCTNYDKHAVICTLCEDRKPKGYGHNCSCSEKQKQVARDMQMRFRRPLAPMPGQQVRELDMQVPDDAVNEELIQRIAKEYYVDTEVTSSV